MTLAACSTPAYGPLETASVQHTQPGPSTWAVTVAPECPDQWRKATRRAIRTWNRALRGAETAGYAPLVWGGPGDWEIIVECRSGADPNDLTAVANAEVMAGRIGVQSDSIIRVWMGIADVSPQYDPTYIMAHELGHSLGVGHMHRSTLMRDHGTPGAREYPPEDIDPLALTKATKTVKGQ